MSTIHIVLLVVVVVLIFGTKKLRNIGSDLGGAVKGFKDGMKDGSATDPAAPTEKVTASTPAADKSTIDVEARQKS